VLPVLFGFPCATAAALSNCTVLSITNPGSWGTTARDVFIAPEEFSTLPIGEPVSLVRWFGGLMNCAITNTTPQYGVGMAAVPGATNVPGQPGMFTTPQLQARGLGYRVGWYAYTDQSTIPESITTPYRELTTVTQTTAPIHWLTPSQAVRNVGRVNARADASIQFFKIGNIQDTGGVRISANISTELIRFYLADSATPNTTTWNVPFVWTSSTFVTKVRACTPALLGPNPNFVNLGTVAPVGTPAPGTVLVEQPFTLTFNCPHLAFERIGFRFDPTHGTESATIMKLKPGDGMAKGAGIRLQMDLSGTDTWSVINYGQNYTISDFNVPGWWEWTPSDDALSATKSRIIQFKAELVRVTGEFAPGKVESSLVIVMRYK